MKKNVTISLTYEYTVIRYYKCLSLNIMLSMYLSLYIYYFCFVNNQDCYNYKQ